jgi:hypothetical protein
MAVQAGMVQPAYGKPTEVQVLSQPAYGASVSEQGWMVQPAYGVVLLVLQ